MGLSKKFVGILASAAIATSVLAGCGISPSSKKTEDGKDSGNKNKQVEITFWNYPNFEVIDNKPGKYEEEIVAAFNKKYPDIKVNVEMISFNGGPEKINAAIASKTQPDVVFDFPGRIIEYGRQGILAPLDDMLKGGDKTDIPNVILDASSLDGKLYMYPFNTTPNMMAFNKTLIEKLGLLDMLPLKNPDRSWTVDDYTKLLKAIKEKAPKDVTPVVVYSKTNQGDQATRALVSNLYGGKTISDDKSEYLMNSSEAVKAMEWIQTGIKDGYILKGGEAMTSGDAIDMYLQGKAASTIIYSPVLKKTSDAKKTTPFEDIFVPFPSPNKPQLEAFIGGFGIFDKGDKAKVDAAKKFVDFVANDSEWGKKNLLSTGAFSVRQSITNLYNDEESKYAEQMVKYLGTYYNAVPGFAEMRTFWFPAIQSVTLGTKKPKEALDEFVKKSNELLKK
ncbi:MAG: ABC transporter substrate-binding protein [Bacillaceae bacterium]